MDEYVSGVVREMELRAADYYFPPASTLYLGGGTPSLLAPDLAGRLVEAARDRYALASDAEVTLEANPGTVTEETLAGFHRAGFNRLSLGVQSFDDQVLQILGRVHNSKAARDAVAAARAAGFANIGIDLIHSLPGQTLRQWEETLFRAVELRPEHISAYGLTVEEGTPLHRQVAAGLLTLPDDDAGAHMYRIAQDILGAAGYEQYEIANYALPGRRSRHNQIYWLRESCLGFGAAAHSFLADPPYGRRWHTPADPTEYLCRIAAGELPEDDVMLPTRREAMAEACFLGLRMSDGIDPEQFRSAFGESPEQIYGAALEPLFKAGFLRYSGGRLFIPPDRLILSNQILVHFL